VSGRRTLLGVKDLEIIVQVDLPTSEFVRDAEISRVTILVVDDHPFLRQGLRHILASEPKLHVIGEARDGEEAIEKARELKPEVILMDISMPGINGIEATRRIHEEMPAIKIIGLSMFEAADIAEEMKVAGAVDYICKSGPVDLLMQTIRKHASRKKN
jgi:DNA-binding NarL/FixJ family response regulator